MIWLTTILSCILATTSDVQSLHLLLVAKRCDFLKGSQSKFDLYLINDSKAVARVPSLKSFTAVYTVRPPSGKDDLAVRGTGPIFSHPLDTHKLPAGGVVHTEIEMELKAEVGDIVEVYVEIGENPAIKSNPVLLLCAAK